MRKAWVLVGMAILLWAGPASGEARYIRVATFNIAQFGAGDEHERSLIGLVNILLATGSYREFTAGPVFGLDVGIVRFDADKRYEWFIGDWHAATAILSDHRPVWIRLRIDLEDDD